MNAYIVCPLCKGHHDTNKVEFLNIEEDILGRDMMTYRCPVTNETSKALVYRGKSNWATFKRP